MDPKDWGTLLTDHSVADPKRSLFELVITALPYSLLWLGVLASVQRGFWPGLLLMIPAAGFLVRLFLIQHDCGHGSFFKHRGTNDFLGRILGVLTVTPYGYWRHTHAMHHASTGNLGRRGIGDIDTLTVSEYRARSRWGRLCYRLARNPIGLLGVGPFYVFILKHRVPAGLTKSGAAPWLSTMGTNLAIASLFLVVGSWIGFATLIMVQLPITLMAGAAGIWLFYVQHQFEETYWAHEPEWSYHASALQSSTHYDLPRALSWLTANIGIHHIHHLASQIPSYRLPKAQAEHPEIQAGARLTLRSSLQCFRFRLWDEDARRLVSLRDLRAN